MPSKILMIMTPGLLQEKGTNRSPLRNNPRTSILFLAHAHVQVYSISSNRRLLPPFAFFILYTVVWWIEFIANLYAYLIYLESNSERVQLVKILCGSIQMWVRHFCGCRYITNVTSFVHTVNTYCNCQLGAFCVVDRDWLTSSDFFTVYFWFLEKLVT